MLSAVLTVTMLVGCGDSMEAGRREETRKDRGHKETRREEQETEESVESKATMMTDVRKVLNRDLSNDYPPTPREVIGYYVEIEKCFYSDSTTTEELEQLSIKARELFDADLLAVNDEENYLTNLLEDVQRFKDDGRRIVSVSVASSVNVDTFQEDGYEFARLSCVYDIIDNDITEQVGIVYLLRRDENRFWKIYGWDNVESINVQ